MHAGMARDGHRHRWGEQYNTRPRPNLPLAPLAERRASTPRLGVARNLQVWVPRTLVTSVFVTSKRFPDDGSAQNRAPACAYEVLVPLGARVPLERAVLHGESANARFEAPNGAAETSQFMTLVGRGARTTQHAWLEFSRDVDCSPK